MPLHVLGDHWALAIVVSPANLLPGNRVQGINPTYIYTLDSLEHNTRCQARARHVIKAWLVSAANSFLKGDVQDSDIVEFQVDDTAIQPNGIDCGPYVHHHLDTFFQMGNPQKIMDHFKQGAGVMTDGDLVNMWRYPTALQCRFTVTESILGELRGQNHSP
ncbi:hypothetical protein FRB90_006150 [Tulasnella sp. 427]|nr:hypothetical protein FRB90_006150 [Tulasnella sp. 427]